MKIVRKPDNEKQSMKLTILALFVLGIFCFAAAIFIVPDATQYFSRNAEDPDMIEFYGNFGQLGLLLLSPVFVIAAAGLRYSHYVHQ